jgi:hypothetical protein
LSRGRLFTAPVAVVFFVFGPFVAAPFLVAGNTEGLFRDGLNLPAASDTLAAGHGLLEYVPHFNY